MHLLTPLFPSPSITPPPKFNTIQYIKHLQHTPTHPYSPTIPLLFPQAKSIFNLPIPTIQYLNHQPIYPLPSPITIHSIPQNQLQQFKHKTKILHTL
ncbi:chorismate-binding protein [Staphylococcus saprophyticus]|uniref:chorismate-binding protein n=1 Tax=Staphylococcus saprophyticus TaxID=29385 RepID=UPI001CD9D629|nr:chorismate-binding protein [Staphylococcus saprophyticus]